jgi:hypothetical protein
LQIYVQLFDCANLFSYFPFGIMGCFNEDEYL